MSKTIKFKDDLFLNSNSIMARNGTKKTLLTFLYRIDTLNLDRTTTLTEDYYFLGQLFNNGNGDSSDMRITGTSGGFTINRKATFDITVSSRGVGGFGVWYGNASAWDYFNILMYRGTDGYYRVYFHRKPQTYHGGTTLMVTSAGGMDFGIHQTPESPNGTLVATFSNSNLTKIG